MFRLIELLVRRKRNAVVGTGILLPKASAGAATSSSCLNRDVGALRRSKELQNTDAEEKPAETLFSPLLLPRRRRETIRRCTVSSLLLLVQIVLR